jgi:hypothetical protein
VAKHYKKSYLRKKDRNRWLIAGGAVAGIGLLVYLYEKNKAAPASTTPTATNVQGQTLPTGNGPALPSAAGTVVAPSSVVAPGA